MLAEWEPVSERDECLNAGRLELTPLWRLTGLSRTLARYWLRAAVKLIRYISITKLIRQFVPL